MSFELTYENTLGETITFGGDRKNSFRFGETDLFDIDQGYEETGGVITSFEPGIKELGLVVFMRHGSVAERNRFEDVISYDTRLTAAGTLHCGDSHIKCYFKDVRKRDWHQLPDYMAAECTVVSDIPVWVRAVRQTLLSEDELEVGGHNYPYDYEHNYLYSRGTSTTLTNPFKLPCKCDIVFPGPCSDPYVIIAGNRYQVLGSFDKGQLVIARGFPDGGTKDVVLRSRNGEERSIFSSGVKTADDHIFAEVPVGAHVATWSGAYNIEVILYEERLSPYLTEEMFERG